MQEIQQLKDKTKALEVELTSANEELADAETPISKYCISHFALMFLASHFLFNFHCLSNAIPCMGQNIKSLCGVCL